MGTTEPSLGILRKVLADAHKTTMFVKIILNFWRKEKDGEGKVLRLRNGGRLAIQCGVVKRDSKYDGQVP